MPTTTPDEMTLATGQPAPPGWYDDPARTHDYRYWDGERWTDGVADGERITEDPLSAAGATAPERPADTMPFTGVWFALLGLFAAIALAVAGAGIGYLLAPHTLLVRLVLGQLGLWAGLGGTCRWASRRIGTGELRRDLGVRATVGDIWRGLGMAFVVRIAAAIVLILLYAFDHHLVGSNLSPLKHLKTADRSAFLTVAIMAVVGAPLIEETFFRGLLMRSLLARWPVALAVVTQAVLFGLCHMSPLYGLGNVGVVTGIATVGLILGWLAYRYRRLGPGMWTHAFFNAMAVLALLATH